MKGLVLGVANDHSIAWAIAKEILAEGGRIGFTHLPDRPDDERQRNRRRVAQLTDPEPNATFLVPMDVSKDDQIAAVMEKAKQEFGTLDFVLHSIAFAPLEDLKGETTNCSREGFRVAMETSAYSLLAVGRLCRGILSTNASILTLTYYGGEKVVPGYNIMGVCKATLDACMRYMAFDLGPAGVRVNAVSAGPGSMTCWVSTSTCRRWAGTSPTRRSARREPGCSPASRRASPARSSTWMLATT
jgi:enoyl-[acyl-carrier protein] reductase I